MKISMTLLAATILVAQIALDSKTLFADEVAAITLDDIPIVGTCGFFRLTAKNKEDTMVLRISTRKYNEFPPQAKINDTLTLPLEDISVRLETGNRVTARDCTDMIVRGHEPQVVRVFVPVTGTISISGVRTSEYPAWAGSNMIIHTGSATFSLRDVLLPAQDGSEITIQKLEFPELQMRTVIHG